jgi:signal transduction histidine kinase
MSIQDIPTTTFRFGGAGAAKRAVARPDFHVLLQRPAVRSLLIDVAAIAVAVLDVWLTVPEKPAGWESHWFSWIACFALLARRRFPLLTVLGTVPGFFVGWSQLAAMIALGFLAHRMGLTWKTWVGAGLVLICRFVLWPFEDMWELTWKDHVLSLIYGGIVAAMPVAIGLLVAARKDLSRRYSELEASRERERLAHARAVRADERAKIAREMHDVVSHEVTLIAMQANALECARTPEAIQNATESIRLLSTRTLEELRSLLGVLRTSTDDDLPTPGLDQLGGLVRNVDVPVRLKVEHLPATIPSQVSSAAYRTVQEALTNVHKHAPGSTATIRVRYAEHQLHVEVRNDKPDKTLRPLRRLPSGGHGLAGLAERALLLDGTFHARSTDDGGFEVRANYPVRA